ncbi:MAG TPA: methylmalonyl Co-A mutase-associated GTPase MeaB, partial [Alphaproteobacteria bacterium]|nr:methylmalonyl Co-A mutase-associated GTPase MeaB [Alphaproteobacteria bacterium]
MSKSAQQNLVAMSSQLQKLRQRLLGQERAALAQAITLIESSRPDHREESEQLLQSLLPHSGRAWRIGISGPPGAGKSTFINKFGLEVIKQGHRVAVLAVDPSSQRDGGAILADKTRMQDLAQNNTSFIRPSPSGMNLGGVARYTRETMLLCEAAGYDVVMVETVGVGQSETMAAQMTDLFLVLIPPANGDELQGMKRGILELADLIVINKADGQLLPFAEQTANEYRHALQLFAANKGEERQYVALCSAMTGQGLSALWQKVQVMLDTQQKNGMFEQKRLNQGAYWLNHELQQQLWEALQQHKSLHEEFNRLQAQVKQQLILPSQAARLMVKSLLSQNSNN